MAITFKIKIKINRNISIPCHSRFIPRSSHSTHTPPKMGAIVSKLCFTCCTGHRTRKTNTATNSQSKLSKIPSLIIERTQVLREVDEGTEYSRILERDFEIKGRSGSSKRSQLNNVESSNLNRSDSTIKVKVII